MMIKISSSRIGRISAQTLDKWFERLLTRMTSQVQKSESAAVGPDLPTSRWKENRFSLPSIKNEASN